MKTFICWLLSIFVLCAENGQINNKHGQETFRLLQGKYAKFFSLTSRDGGKIKITESDPIGKYLINKFSTKSPTGWVCCWGRDLVVKPSGERISYSFGQTYFHRDDDCSEVLISKKVEGDDFPTEIFWRTLIFEICNASGRGQELELLQRKLKNSEISKEIYAKHVIELEYKSACEAQEFQEKIWWNFCQSNQVKCGTIPWFFKPGTTCDKWIEELAKSEAGREYIKFFK